MWHEIAWCVALAASLFWVAGFAAFASRRRHWWNRWGLRLILLTPLGAMGAFVYWAGNLKYSDHIQHNYLSAAIGLFLCGTVGIAAIASARGNAAWRARRLLGGFILSAALLAIALWRMDVNADANLEAAIVQAKLDYLADAPPMPGGASNAADIYAKALARLDNEPSGPNVTNPPMGSADVFDPNEAGTIAYLRQEEPTLALLRQAGAMPYCKFNDDMDNPSMMDRVMNGSSAIMRLNAFYYAGQVLDLDAELRTARGEVALALGDVSAMTSMARNLAQRPIVVWALTSCGIDQRAINRVEALLPKVTKATELNDLKLTDADLIPEVFRHSLQGDLVYSLVLLRVEPADPIYDVTIQTTTADAWHRVMLQSDQVRGDVALKRDVVAAARKPYLQAEAQLARIKREYFDGPEYFGSFGKITARADIGMVILTGRWQAKEQCAQVAVAATRYRLDHGTLPTRLGDLAPVYLPSVPLDPFDGQELKLKITANQWTVSSVGEPGLGDDQEFPDSKSPIAITLPLK